MPPGAVIVTAPTVQVPEFVTVNAFVDPRVTLPPKFTAAPVTESVPRAVPPPISVRKILPVPAEIVNAWAPEVVALIALANVTALSVVASVTSPERVIKPLVPPFCVIPPGAVIVTAPIVHTSEFVTVKVFATSKVTVPPRLTVDPVIATLPKAVVVPREAKDIAPVPAVIVRLLPPLIAVLKVTALFVVANVAAPEIIVVLEPFCVMPPGAVIVPAPIVHTSEFVTVNVFVAAKVTVPPRFTVDPVIATVFKLVPVPRPDKEIAPVPALIVRFWAPFIAAPKVTGLFVVVIVTSLANVVVPVPF